MDKYDALIKSKYKRSFKIDKLGRKIIYDGFEYFTVKPDGTVSKVRLGDWFGYTDWKPCQ